MNLNKSYSSAINTSSIAVADYARMIKYHSTVAEPDTDLLHELKAFYENEKQKLENLWRKVASKGQEFLNEVLAIVKDFFEELVSDVLAFLKKHGLQFIIDLVKDLF